MIVLMRMRIERMHVEFMHIECMNLDRGHVAHARRKTPRHPPFGVIHPV